MTLSKYFRSAILPLSTNRNVSSRSQLFCSTTLVQTDICSSKVSPSVACLLVDTLAKIIALIVTIILYRVLAWYHPRIASHSTLELFVLQQVQTFQFLGLYKIDMLCLTSF